MELHLIPQYNQFTSQYQKKRFINKHAKSTWRHHQQKKYYKKFLNHRKKTSTNDYLKMYYKDILSVHQQQLEDKLNYLDDNDDSHTIKNGKIIRRSLSRTPNYLIDKESRYRDALHECAEYIVDVVSIDYSENYYDLCDLQIQNYEENCNSMFLDYRNWAIYKLKTKSTLNMYRAFGQYFVDSDQRHYYGTMSEYYYKQLSREYYNSMLSCIDDSDEEDLSFLPEKCQNCIQLKNIHMDMILDKIWWLGKRSMKQTLDAIYYTIPSLSIDVCQEIIAFMVPFPQIAPKAVNQCYDYDFVPTPDRWMRFRWSKIYLSETGLIYPLNSRTLSISDEDAIELRFDDENVVCLFDLRDLGIDDIEDECYREYRVTETYHARKAYDEFIMVGKLEHAVADTLSVLYIFIHHDECEKSVIILSQFWMNVWEKIESNCIKVDCYNYTKFPEEYKCDYNNYHSNEADMGIDQVVYQYEY